jgi:hypothetical protein
VDRLDEPGERAGNGVLPASRVWVGLEGENILICTSDAIWKAKDMRRDPRVALSVTDLENPYRMAAIQGRVVEVRPDEGCRYMDPISHKYTGAPFPSRGADRVCFVIAVEKAAQRILRFTHKPGGDMLAEQLN